MVQIHATFGPMWLEIIDVSYGKDGVGFREADCAFLHRALCNENAMCGRL